MSLRPFTPFKPGQARASAPPLVYATWNPADKHAGLILQDNNLTVYHPGGGWEMAVRANKPLSGKKYWLLKLTLGAGSTLAAGVANESALLNEFPGFNANSIGWLWSSSYTYFNGAPYGPTPGIQGLNDVGMVAVDTVARKMWVGKNGVWIGDPAAGTGPVLTALPAGTLYPLMMLYNANTKVLANFGASSFAYPAPAGFTGVY